MSEPGPCVNLYPSCGPQAVAAVNFQDGGEYRLCKQCLDICFDAADDAPYMEPASWRWLASSADPSYQDWVDALRDPRNHTIVISAIGQAARRGEPWLQAILRGEIRAGRLRHQVMR